VKYTELPVWQASMDLAQSVFALTAGFPVEQRFVLPSQAGMDRRQCLACARRTDRQGWPYAVQADDFVEGTMMLAAQSAIRDPQSDHA